jgi:hypothetical protein
MVARDFALAANDRNPPILWKNTVLHLQIFENWKVVL